MGEKIKYRNKRNDNDSKSSISSFNLPHRAVTRTGILDNRYPGVTSAPDLPSENFSGSVNCLGGILTLEISHAFRKSLTHMPIHFSL